MKKNLLIKFWIIVIVGVVLSPLFVMDLKADTDNNFAGYYYWSVEYRSVGTNTWDKILYFNVLTNDPTVYGSLNPTGLPSGFSSTGTLYYAGVFTNLEINLGRHTSTTVPTLPSPSFGGSTFTYGSGSNQNNQEIVKLNTTQYNALINAINNASGGSGGSSIDYTALLNTANGLLQNIYNNLPNLSGNLDLSTLLTAVQNTYTKVSNIDSNVTNVYNSIIQLSSDILSRLDNIDTLVDTISWRSASYTNLGISSDLNNWQSTDMSALKFYQAIQVSTYGQNLYKFNTGVRTNFLNRAEYLQTIVKFYLFNNSNKQMIELNYPYYVSNESRTLVLYINGNLFMQSDYYLLIEYSNTVNLRYDRTVSLNYIDPNDIEYWTLASFIQDYHYYNSSQIPDNSQQQQDLDDMIDDYISSENNIINNFNNSMNNPALDPNNLPSSPITWGSAFISSLSFIGILFDDITMSLTGGNPIYLMIQFSLMFGLALLIIGKRA